MAMMIKALLVLAVGALAQNDRVTIQSGCTFDGTTFDWCATASDNPSLEAANVTDAPMTVYWTETEGAEGVVTIAMSTPRTDAAYCAWGISDSMGMPDSSTVFFSPFANESNADTVIGAQKVAPTPAPEGERQILPGTWSSEMNEGGLSGSFQRNRMIGALADSRQFSGDTYMIAACGAEQGFHNLNYVWFQLDVDTGALVGAPNAAAPLRTMSAAITVAVSAAALSLWL